MIIKSISPIWHFMAAVCLVANPVALAAEPKALEPSSPWTVNYAQDECLLVREFGTGDEAIGIRFARSSSLDSFDILIAGPKIPKLPERLEINFGLGEPNLTQSYKAYSLKLDEIPFRFIRWWDTDPQLSAAMANAKIVTIRHADKLDIAMRWTGWKAALKALEVCHHDLLKSWGLDVAMLVSAKVRPQPIGSPGRWVTNLDYPDAALRAGLQGNVTFLLKLAVDGSITECSIIRSSKVPLLDAATCELVKKRAKFKPALDMNDQPIIGYYFNRVRWDTPQ